MEHYILPGLGFGITLPENRVIHHFEISPSYGSIASAINHYHSELSTGKSAHDAVDIDASQQLDSAICIQYTINDKDVHAFLHRPLFGSSPKSMPHGSKHLSSLATLEMRALVNHDASRETMRSNFQNALTSTSFLLDLEKVPDAMFPALGGSYAQLCATPQYLWADCSGSDQQMNVALTMLRSSYNGAQYVPQPRTIDLQPVATAVQSGLSTIGANIGCLAQSIERLPAINQAMHEQQQNASEK